MHGYIKTDPINNFCIKLLPLFKVGRFVIVNIVHTTVQLSNLQKVSVYLNFFTGLIENSFGK